MDDNTDEIARVDVNTMLGYAYAFQRKYDQAIALAAENLKAAKRVEESHYVMEALGLMARSYRETEVYAVG